MTLLGIDVGTTGCKVIHFSVKGDILASAYREYDTQSPSPGTAQLDAQAIWRQLCDAISSVTMTSTGMEIKALSVSSFGEAVVPVSADRQILGPSILNFDVRGEEFLTDFARTLPAERLYATTGNTLGNHYSLTKLKWIQTYQPELYARTFKFLHWGAFISFMLGADPVVDYSLANRTLLFDLNTCSWSETLLSDVGLDREKLPTVLPSGTMIGTVSDHIAAELGLPKGIAIISGAHDQCATAVGCGVVDSGSAVYGMGTFHCITPAFTSRPSPETMIERGLNCEHHAIPGRYVCFIYNQGGSLVKWYRNTFAATEHRLATEQGRSVYPALFDEIPDGPSSVMVLPHFSVTGPPAYIADSSGFIAGLSLGTTRGDILKGIVEGAAYYLKESVDSLPATGIRITNYRAVGGGSNSDAWVQTCADIFGIPIMRPATTEAGALGAAIIAGVGSGILGSYEQGVQAMVKMDRSFEPDERRHERYQSRYQKYRQIWPLMGEYLRDLSVAGNRQD